MVDKEQWRRQRTTASRTQQTTQQSLVPASSSLSLANAHPTQTTSGYQTAYQDPSFLSGSSPNKPPSAQNHGQHRYTIDDTAFMGPSSGSVDSHQTAYFATALRGKESFGKEFTYSVEARKDSDLHDGSVKPGDELGKWLVDSGASNHFSPFKHLFISLIRCIPPVDILTGNGWVTSFFYGSIPLILLVEGRVVHVNLDNVLYLLPRAKWTCRERHQTDRAQSIIYDVGTKNTNRFLARGLSNGCISQKSISPQIHRFNLHTI